MNTLTVICAIIIYLTQSKNVFMYRKKPSEPFVKVGNYMEHEKYHKVNQPDCGLRVVPKNLKVSYHSRCFPGNFSSGYAVENIKVRVLGEPDYHRIAHGRVASLGEVPWALLVRVLYDNKVWYECSGSLATLKWVLTAAHCFDDRNGSKWTRVEVYAGNNRGTPVDKRWSTIVEFHPDYKPRPVTVNDMALIRLHESFIRTIGYCCNELKEYEINTVCLPETNVTNAKPELATLFGFGMIEPLDTPQFMYRGDFRIQPVGQCKHNDTYVMPPEGMCSDNGPWSSKDTRVKAELRDGDSGAGLIQYTNDDYSRAIVVGVAQSLTNAPIQYNYNTTYFVSVSMKMDWILKTIEKG